MIPMRRRRVAVCGKAAHETGMGLLRLIDQCRELHIQRAG